jgi:hypothetical protein
VREEHVYATHPAKLCDGHSDTAAVELLKAQLKLVLAFGWEEPLMAHCPTLDLTLGQTSTKEDGVAANKKALVATLKAIASAVETLGLEATEELRAGAARSICRELPSLSSEVTQGRRDFEAKNKQLVSEAVALATAPDEDFERRTKSLVGKCFFDIDEKTRSKTGWFLIDKL